MNEACDTQQPKAERRLAPVTCLDQKQGCAFGKTGDSVMPYHLLITHPHVERV